LTDTLDLMDAFLGSASPEGLARVRRMPTGEMHERLLRLQLSPPVVDELVANWEATRSSPRWSSLLGALGDHVARARGDVDTPVAIWRDLDDYGPGGRLLYYYLFALEIDALSSWWSERGVPDDVRAATIGALARHGETHRLKHATTGLDAGWWMVPILRGEILQVGSLKFHQVHLEVGTLAPRPWLGVEEMASRGEGFRRGDASLGVHIPARIDLSPAALDMTFARAREVLGEVWPCSTRRIATCQSWMMDDRLVEALGPDSRIVAFQRRFELIEPYVEDTATAMYFIFGVEGVEAGRLTPTSRLQHALLEVVARGGQWRSRTGWLDFD
jgi:hypothetical protein